MTEVTPSPWHAGARSSCPRSSARPGPGHGPAPFGGGHRLEASRWLLLTFVLSLGFVSLLAPERAGARMYRWTDAEGQIHLSDQPPPGFVEAEPEAGVPRREPAAPPRRTPATALGPERFSKGLLWKIEKRDGSGSGAAASHLFGTIHLADPRVVRLPPEVKAAFDSSTSFCAETSLDFSAFLAVGMRMMYTDGRTLESAIGKELFERVAREMAGRGLPRDLLASFKPWVVLVMLEMPSGGMGIPLDMLLYQSAASGGKSLCALETIEEQIAVFEGMSERDQIVLLREALAHAGEIDAQTEKMVQAYLARDLAGMLRMMDEEQARSGIEAKRVGQAVMDRLLGERNRRMALRMAPKIEQGGAFIAVGAAHLAGEDGLLVLLEERGYAVARIY